MVVYKTMPIEKKIIYIYNMDTISIEYFKTPFGELILGSFEEKLCMADWRYRKMRESIDSRIKKGLRSEYKEEGSEIIEKVNMADSTPCQCITIS